MLVNGYVGSVTVIDVQNGIGAACSNSEQVTFVHVPRVNYIEKRMNPSSSRVK